MSDPNLQVELLNLQHIEVDEPRILDVAQRTALAEGAKGELSVVLVDEQRMTELNSQFRDECGPTDVLSFSIDGLISGGIGLEEDSPLIIGEVIICPEVGMRQCDGDFHAEMDLLVAHGVLHLLGHDHESEDGAAAMGEREFEITGRRGASSQ